MLNISKNIYAGWTSLSPSKFDLPEATIIPIGDSETEKRKLETFTKQVSIIKELNNTPLPGFTLYKSKKRYYSSSDLTWLVIDPRGFLVRITNENLENILYVSGITEGLIQEQCVWARQDNQTKMTLIPVSSSLYTEAVKNTELIDGKVNIEDVSIGDEVLLQNELTGIYMGVLSLYGSLNSYSQKEEYKPQIQARRQIICMSPGHYHYQKDIKILKIIKKTDNPLTREESAEKINNEILTISTYFTNSVHITPMYYGISNRVDYVSVNTVPRVKMRLEEVDELEATRLFYDSQSLSDFGKLLLEDDDGRKYLIDFPGSFTGRSAAIGRFHVYNMYNINEEFFEKIHLIDEKNYYNSVGKGPVYSIKDFKKYYRIVKCIKKETYI